MSWLLLLVVPKQKPQSIALENAREQLVELVTIQRQIENERRQIEVEGRQAEVEITSL
jgi:hypothetical protein